MKSRLVVVAVVYCMLSDCNVTLLLAVKAALFVVSMMRTKKRSIKGFLSNKKIYFVMKTNIYNNKIISIFIVVKMYLSTKPKKSLKFKYFIDFK